MGSSGDRCWAKCTIMDHWEYYTDTLCIYEVDEDIPTHILDSVEIIPAGTRWAKVRPDRCCFGECYIWKLQDVPPVFTIPTVEIDSSQSPPVKVVFVPDIKVLVKKGGIEWREVVCYNDLTDDLLTEVKGVLRSAGHYDTEESFQEGSWGAADKAALVDFQNSKSLPVGQFDFETLESLGITQINPVLSTEKDTCIEKVMIQDKYKTFGDTLGVFELDEEIPESMLQQVEFYPDTTRWDYVYAPKLCTLGGTGGWVWQLQNIPAVIGIPEVVVDTFGAPPMRIVFIPEVSVLVEKGGYEISQPVFCENNLTPEMLLQMLGSLKVRGYVESTYPRWGAAEKAALMKFQREESLPVGQLDFETLSVLGVDF